MNSETNSSIAGALELAKHAKVDITDLKSTIQCLEFAPDVEQNTDDVHLLELPEELLAVLEIGQRLHVKGDDEDTLVLCTDKSTYEMRQAETSNAMVVARDIQHPQELSDGIPNLITTCQVGEVHHKYFEVKPCRPRLEKLQQMLAENPYKGNLDENPDKRKYGMLDLLDTVQASEEEILLGIKKQMAYEVNGFYRTLDFEYHFKVLSLILNLIDSNSWSLDSVPKVETLETLQGLEPEAILDQCFDYFLEPVPGTDGQYKIRDDKVSRFCAEVLLVTNRKFNLQDFLMMWQQGVPDGVITSLSQLDGLVLINQTAPATILYYPVKSLPVNPVERFAALFEQKSTWTTEEITPYLEDLTTEQTKVSTLLAKYTRASTQSGIKTYTSKYSK